LNLVHALGSSLTINNGAALQKISGIHYGNSSAKGAAFKGV
jgi:hypothetical protein